jgi:effector-binding domain-containing protein
MGRELEVEFGVPVETETIADTRVRAEILPAGRYVTLLHVGPYDGLVAANAALQRWARDRGITWDMDEGVVWRARVEHYLTNPVEQPDSSRWETELAYLTADS